jgi:hypothetical protein
MPGDRHATGLGYVLELTVTALDPNEEPAVFLDKLDRISDLDFSLPRVRARVNAG